MWEKNDNTAEQIPDTAEWENWILQLSENLREMLQLTAASVLADLDTGRYFPPIRPVPVSGFLTERIASAGDMAVLPQWERGAGMQEEYPLPSLRQENSHRRVRRTPYETARELQKQSELLLRT